jgi:hypothetical protein
MNTEEIILKICDESKSSLTVWGIFAEAFDERDAVKLLKKRAFLIEHCEQVIKELEYEEEEILIFQDVFKALSYKNLGEQMSVIGHLLTPAHRALVRTTFKFYYSSKHIRREYAVQELLDISEELRAEVKEDDSLPKEQKELLLDVCNAIEQSKKEHDMVGNYAISKLYERLVGKAMIYQEVFSSIKSKTVLEKLKKLYAKAQEVNEVMGFLLSTAEKFQKVLGFLN